MLHIPFQIVHLIFMHAQQSGEADQNRDARWCLPLRRGLCLRHAQDAAGICQGFKKLQNLSLVFFTSISTHMPNLQAASHSHGVEEVHEVHQPDHGHPGSIVLGIPKSLP